MNWPLILQALSCATALISTAIVTASFVRQVLAEKKKLERANTSLEPGLGERQ